MITVHTLAELRQAVRAAREDGQRIGFVPTMGNLHAGHISLVQRSLDDGCFTVASIFVNPLQFNDQGDLSRYPRTLPADQEQLSAAGCQLLFAPSVEEMYPEGQGIQTLVHVPEVSAGLCGGSRPGHFDGVSTVVTKLFNQVQPDVAYFGEKDFQQVAVIRKMVNDLCAPIEIEAVPTARAEDGLALSSRNGYLTTAERAQAPALYQALNQVVAALQSGTTITDAVTAARDWLDAQGLQTDYMEVRRQQDLKPASASDSEIVVLGAAFLGKARLIDNVSATINATLNQTNE